MRSRLCVVAVLGLALVPLGCGDKEQTATTSAPTTSTTTTIPSVDQLQPMLLAASDVGASWQVGHAVTDADFADSVQVPCDSAALDPVVAQRLRAVTGRQFEPTDNSYKHLMQMFTIGESGQLAADFDAYRASIDTCPAGGTWNNAPVTTEKLTIPDLGDQRAAYTVAAADSAESQITWYIRSAMVRVDGVIVGLGLTEVLSSPDQQPAISDAEYVALLEKAVAKVSA